MMPLMKMLPPMKLILVPSSLIKELRLPNINWQAAALAYIGNGVGQNGVQKQIECAAVHRMGAKLKH